jgi:hypothetical protein
VDDQVNAALRTYLNLLTPEQLRAALERISMTQREAFSPFHKVAQL